MLANLENIWKMLTTVFTGSALLLCWDPIRPYLSRQDNGWSDATNTSGPSWSTIETGPELDGSVVDFLSTKGDESFVD